jgi:hypothetical protein
MRGRGAGVCGILLEFYIDRPVRKSAIDLVEQPILTKDSNLKHSFFSQFKVEVAWYDVGGRYERPCWCITTLLSALWRTEPGIISGLISVVFKAWNDSVLTQSRKTTVDSFIP